MSHDLISVTSSWKWNVSSFCIFSKSNGESITSPVLQINGTKWQLVFYPRGNTAKSDGFSSIFLKSCNSTDVEISYTIAILNSNNKTFLKVFFCIITKKCCCMVKLAYFMIMALKMCLFENVLVGPS